jgi:anti-anti-sigma factor
MPLRITQKECIRNQRFRAERRNEGKTERTQNLETVLKVQGSLYLEDAELLEKICRDISNETGCHLTLDLADLAFLDSESASVLCRLKREQGVSLAGLHLFIAKVIELTEAEAMVAEYLPKTKDENCHTAKRPRLRACGGG